MIAELSISSKKNFNLGIAKCAMLNLWTDYPGLGPKNNTWVLGDPSLPRTSRLLWMAVECCHHN